jgi:3-phosphoshikimate 1-carboxyvinyltransferase
VWTPPAPGARALRIPDPPLASAPHSPHSRADVLTRVVTARPPGSKSLTNRAVLLAALADGTSTLHNPLLDADDANVMREAIAALGAKPTIRGSDLIIQGVAGRWSSPHTTTLTLNNAGTAVRFLAAAAWLARAPVTIDGSPRMRQRPIAELADLLRALDCSITYHAADGFPPLTINPPATGPTGSRTLDVGPTQSGQFISALLLAAAFVKGGLTLRATQGLTSASYIEMTLALLAKLGAQVQSSLGMRVIRVGPPPDRAGLAPFDLDIEPDASGATYLWAAGMLRPGLTVLVPGLRPSQDVDDHPTPSSAPASAPSSDHLARSLQGDANFVLLLQRMGATVQVSDAGTSVAAPHDGVIHAIEADMADMPDAAMTLAVLASRANAPTLLRGVRTLRVKETDRIAALTTELAKVGTRIDSPFEGDPDALLITPGPDHLNPVEFHTYDDHRMAMALSLLGLVRPGVTILDPWCVAKTYPSFWTHFASLANFTAPH